MAVLLAIHGVILLVIASNAVYLRRRNRDWELAEKLPRVSILVPARNEEENLQRLLPSLWMQDYADFEVVVVDDASEDGTWDVLQSQNDSRMKVIRSSGPPEGWIGKVHALFRAAEEATGEVFLFLDADAVLTQEDSLRRLVSRLLSCGENAVLTGLPSYTDRGSGLILTSMVPFAVLSALPLALVPHTKFASLSALNGQCWLIRAADYHRLHPHLYHKSDVLEDVQIGRYLKRAGMKLHMLSVQREVSVRMYRTFGEAWRGFRKNAYLIQGGNPFVFLILHLAFWLILVFAPLFGWPLLITLYLIKGSSDRIARLPLWVSLVTPLVLLCAVLVQLDSAAAHWTNRVNWKGRRV